MTTEVRTDTPGFVIPILEEELADFSTEATEFLAQNRDELEFTKLYLQIQEVRFRDRLSVSYHV